MVIGKFDALKRRFENKPGVTNPAGLAAAIGRNKFGAKVMAKAAAEGKPAVQVAKSKKLGK